MQPDGRFVEDVERLPLRPLGKLLRQLDALRLAAGERRGRLPQADVAQAHLLQRAQPPHDARDGGEEVRRFVHRQRQHLGDVQPLVAHLERLAVVAASVADVAGDVDLRQELHLDAQRPLSLAGFAAPALDVEGEAPRLVAAHLRLRQRGEEFADGRHRAGVGGRIGARRPADGRLVDVDDAVEFLQALDGVAAGGGETGAVEPTGRASVERLHHQGALAGAGDAGYADELPQREADIDPLEVVLAGIAHDEPRPRPRAALGGDGDPLPTRKVGPGERGRVGDDRLRRTGDDDLAAVFPRTRP